ncbi:MULTISPECIES: hypothetical protein [Chryseobacterium]|uniref:Lipoprotein n=1 Tax=Chryseobacterium geocarposphaerae TaxID=1416776 RepID=A0ABU1LB74_9FLAO|nr:MULTISPECIES: hypothetical protein [Chryseobacterium]MDR6403972.1 hypothetical protein [Chryseobacterium geocarposphaerae]MDR6698509.1 hypothetical protein [Chryseobacterium ginsenosidimutans]
MQKIIILATVLLLCISCKSYIDSDKNNNVKASSFLLQYNEENNLFHYYNNVNGIADKQVFYNTHFKINIPKKIINWSMKGQDFIFEYDNKQIIYIYVPYKNEVKEFGNWELKDIDYHDALSLNDYWEERNYNDNHLYKEHNGRISKLYTNGKCKILLYNIKTENLSRFIESAKTFNIIP